MTLLAPEVMDPIEEVKPKDSTTLMVTFGLKTGATHYFIRITNDDGFFREDTVSSSPAEIKSLSPYTEYTLNIMAGNSAGHSQPSLPVTAKTGRLFVGVCYQKPNRPWPLVFCCCCFFFVLQCSVHKQQTTSLVASLALQKSFDLLYCAIETLYA